MLSQDTKQLDQNVVTDVIHEVSNKVREDVVKGPAKLWNKQSLSLPQSMPQQRHRI